MLFIVTSYPKTTPDSSEPDHLYPIVVLQEDNWNDFHYMTACKVYVVLEPNKTPETLGHIRIMYQGQQEQNWVFSDGPKRFPRLGNNFCSLADLNFYKNLRNIGKEFSIEFLEAIRDAAYSSKIWNSFSEDPCFQTSLLRETSSAIEARDTVPGLFGRGERKHVTKFTFTTKLPGALNDLRISFDFRRGKSSTIPYRAMLLVGRNGAGKTQMLSKLAIALSGLTEEEGLEGKEREASEKRIRAGRVNPMPSFYSVVAISFNAFDKFEIPKDQKNSRYSYTYCGIRSNNETLYTENNLIERIEKTIESMDKDQSSTFVDTLKNVLGVQQSEDFFASEVLSRYKKMSAGQRIVLNILSHLIANLKDRTLVLFDEPETHLHPSLMTTLFTEMFHLLDKFKSFAIIATHAPILAQQVPSKSIRIISRIGEYVEVKRPDIECFGESLSEISNALFETREHERDYTAIIDKMLKANNNDPEKIEAMFPKGIGANARIYLWATARSGQS